MTQISSRTRHSVALQYDLSDVEFQKISKLAHQNYGLCLPETKKALVYARLSKRLRVLGLRSFSEYCSLLSDEKCEERTQLLTALTTNVTHFFREAHHFETLQQQVFPDLIDRARKGQTIRIWSAGCSSGQEPYSIAMSMLDFASDVSQLDIRIRATDIDPQILQVARGGEYPSDSFDVVPAHIRNANTYKVDQKRMSVSKRVKDLVDFEEMNLVQDWASKPQFDVIFCRNVTIYFDSMTKSELWCRFRHALQEGGYLFIGHSERLDRETSAHFKTIGVTAFKKGGEKRNGVTA